MTGSGPSVGFVTQWKVNEERYRVVLLAAVLLGLPIFGHVRNTIGTAPASQASKITRLAAPRWVKNRTALAVLAYNEFASVRPCPHAANSNFE